MPAEDQSRAESVGGALILAAGFGRRFGSDKRHHQLPDGEPMLLTTLSNYDRCFSHLAVALRADDGPLAAQIQARFPAVRIIHAEHAALGMGHSLAAGIQAVAADWSYVCIGLGDMPFIRSETLRRLFEVFRRSTTDTILQPSFDGTPGNPVFFNRCDFPALAALTGDQGARNLLLTQAARVQRIAVDDRGVLEDVDRPPESA